MATFDELLASRNRLAANMQRISDWQTRARVLLRRLDHQLNWRGLDTVNVETALLLQELNRELKRDNDEAEAKDE